MRKPFTGILKKGAAIALSAAMTVWACPATAFAANASGLADGTYEGQGQGYRSAITVAVQVSGGKIANIEVTAHNEDNPYWKNAQAVIDEIIAAQSTDVDTVSGATFSSQGIKSAVNAALSGEDPTPDASIFAGGTGTAADPFLISTPAQLQDFASSLTNQRTYKGYTVALANDIDVSNKEWVPVGGSLYTFNGTFDGCGHTITGMHIGDEKTQAVTGFADIGMFGKLGGAALVENVTIDDMYFSIDLDGQTIAYVGGIAGASGMSGTAHGGATIDNCTVNGTIEVADQNNNIWAAGIIGMPVGGAVINSTSDVDIYADMDVSVADYGGWLEAGGITGLNFWALTANCVSKGDITVDYSNTVDTDHHYAAAGGLSGLDLGSTLNSVALGNVTSVGPSDYIGALSGFAEEGKSSALFDKAYYNADTVLTVNNSAIETKPYGVVESGVSHNETALDKAALAALPATLNANIAGLSADEMAKYSVVPAQLKSFSTVSAKTASYAKKFGDAAFALDAAGENVAGLTYKSSNTKVATVNAAGKVSIVGAGTAKITVAAAPSTNYSTAFLESKTVTVNVAKAAQSLKVNKAKKTAKRGKYTSKIKVTKAKTAVSFEKVSGSKLLTVAKNGKIKVAKKAVKGKTYSVKVKASAAANSNYSATSKTVTIKVKVK